MKQCFFKIRQTWYCQELQKSMVELIFVKNLWKLKLNTVIARFISSIRAACFWADNWWQWLTEIFLLIYPNNEAPKIYCARQIVEFNGYYYSQNLERWSGKDGSRGVPEMLFKFRLEPETIVKKSGSRNSSEYFWEIYCSGQRLNHFWHYMPVNFWGRYFLNIEICTRSIASDFCRVNMMEKMHLADKSVEKLVFFREEELWLRVLFRQKIGNGILNSSGWSFVPVNPWVVDNLEIIVAQFFVEKLRMGSLKFML